MLDMVSVGIRKKSEEASSHLLSVEGFQRSFLTHDFFEGDRQAFVSHVISHVSNPGGHVPTSTGYVLFDFTDLTIVSYQTAASVDSVPRRVLADICKDSPVDAAALIRSITHRDNSADGIGKRPIGPFDGSEMTRLCRYADVHERFSTFYFEIPGWRAHWGILSPDACRSTFAQLDARLSLTPDERTAWQRRIERASAGRSLWNDLAIKQGIN
ncbi:hypothetical protein G6L37_05635 [Agrobacterium rubi]|nr:hypothetical protein [Agrobacterium rubi]NTF24840.1 hypothetical protein [Agrobacterium rubi]